MAARERCQNGVLECNYIEPFSLLTICISAEEVRRRVANLCDVEQSSVKDVFPCTPLQEGLLALTVRQPDYYVVRYALQLRSNVDIAHLHATWSHVLATTPILQTRIIDLAGEGFVQAVVATPFEWTTHEGSLDDGLVKDQNRAMGLGTPLSRFMLVQDRKCQQRTLIWTMHHALYDFCSVPLLIQRVNRAYGNEQLSPSPPFQRFIQHIRRMNASHAERIWTQHLAEAEAPLYPPLPSGNYRPSADKTAVRLMKDPRWSEKSEVRAMTTIWAAWAILIGQHTGIDEALFGVTTFGRQAALPDIAAITGPTMATIPLKIVFAQEATITEFLQSVRKAATNLAAAEQLGLQRIRKVSADAERACQFQTLVDVNLQEEYLNSTDGPFEPSSLADVSASDTPENGPLFSTFALKVQFKLSADGLNCMFTYDSRVLSTDQVHCLQHQLEHILVQLCAPENSGIKLKDLDWMGQTDLERIWSWNATVPERVDACVHDLISETARARPNSLAVYAWDGDFTYGELDRLSTLLAHYLVDLGVGRGMVVPLCFEKSKWTAVAIQGVMKAGGACVTMDSTQPEAHLRRITDQVSARFFLSSIANKALAGRVVGPDTAILIPESILSSPLAPQPACNLPIVSPADNIYIVFTSGSTGAPKGAVLTHSNFSSAIFHQREALCMKHTDRVFDYVSYAFDVSWLNALLTLAVGACLCTPSEDERKGDIAATIRRYAVTFADLTPSITRLIEPSEVPSLRHLTFGGEEVLASDVSRWQHLEEVVNGYGPAECTPKSTTYEYVSGASKLANEIGYGVGLNCWVVHPDKPDRLAIIGSIGELWLEGPLVGSGYLGQPDKTSAAYIEDPPWLLRGSPSVAGRVGRLYKTGDLVRYNSDGSLIYLKRKDTQVKVRGQRVELAEIEHHVRNALATEYGELSVVAEMIVPADGEHKVLTAFFTTPDAGKAASVPELRARVKRATESLKEQVPAYMIPGAYLPLAIMPMSATGKTDRRKLREMGSSMTLAELTALRSQKFRGPRRAPRSTVECRLQTAWASTLHVDVDSIGLDDNFFQGGGDSLLAIRLVSAARQQGLSLNVADVFKQPILGDLAVLAGELSIAASTRSNIVAPFSLLQKAADVENVRSHVAAACGVHISQIQDAFPCTPLQEGLMALSARRKGDYVPQFVLPLRKSVETERFRSAWTRVVSETPILRTRIIELAGQSLTQVTIDEAAEWNLSVHDLDEYLQKDKDIDVGLGTQLARYAIINDRKRGERFFVWTIHHALYDGWSVDLIIRNALHVYLGKTPPVPTSFQRFVEHISTDVDQVLAERLWRQHLEGLEAQPFPSIISFTGQPMTDQALTHSIGGIRWPREGITASTVVRAALSMTIMQYTDVEEALFGTSSSGRQANMPGIEEVLGPTLATVPVRICAKRDETTAQFLQRVQRESVELSAGEQLGLQRIRFISADAERACQFQTLLVVQPKSQSTATDQLFEAANRDRTFNVPTNEVAAFSTYALMIECTIAETGVVCRVSFDTRVLRRTDVQRILYTLEHSLRQLSAPNNASKQLVDVDLVSPQDLESIWTWNGSLPQTDQTSMLEVLRDVVQQSPNAPAVCAWDGELTYRELDSLSSHLAYNLVHQRIGRNTFVPLCFEKSLWTSVAILGVMKAGAASVALDCNLPVQRLQSIVSQVSPQLILSSANCAELAGMLTSVPVMTIDMSSLQKLPRASSLDSLPDVSSSDILYAVFTSGSTGVPKGTSVTHQSFSSAIKHQAGPLCYSRDLRTYNFVSHSFDVFWHDTLRTFAAGACLCVPSESDRNNDISGSFQKLRANSLSIPPSAARLINPITVPALKHLILGGELVTAPDVTRWGGKVRDILNVYGPAECVPPITSVRCDLTCEANPTLGRGRGVNIWLVNPFDHNKLSAIGAVGEAVVEGPLVGEGYMANQELSKSVFVTDPDWLLRGTSMVPGRHGRLYKTGDLLKYSEDGALIFVSRKDAQVKINGQRFELADVDQHIHDVMDADERDIQLVTEVITPNQSKKAMLVAFVFMERVAHKEQDIVPKLQRLKASWNERLLRRLAAYMIPRAYIPLPDGIPMTATGKTDRRRLRAIGSSMTLAQLNSLSTEQNEKRMPTTAIEGRLRELWSSILRIETSGIGIDDSFLQIGGDSITAMQLVSAAREQGLLLSVADVFKQPVLCELATSVRETGAEKVAETIKPFSLLADSSRPEETRSRAADLCNVSVEQVQDVFPCTPLQEALLAQTVKRAGDYNARFTLKLRRSVDIKRFREAWEAVSRGANILRTRIVDIEGQGLVQVVIDEPVQWLYSQCLEEYLEADRKRNVDLGSPLANHGLIKDETGHRYFVWTIHHALYDGWSVTLYMERLAQAYMDDEMTPLQPFQEFISYVQNVDEATSKATWEATFEGLETQVFPSLPDASYQPRADKRVVHLIDHLQWPKKSDITASTLVRAAWSILAGEYTNSSEVVFGATVIGRQAAVRGIDRIAGPTIATVPVRVCLRMEETVRHLLGEIQQQAIKTIPFEQLGLKRLRTFGDDVERACQFQTLLVVQPTVAASSSTQDIFEHSILAEESTDADEVNATFSTYALQIVCDLRDDGLTLSIIADSQIIEEIQLHRMTHQFEHILRQICTLKHDKVKLAEIETINARDLDEILARNPELPEPAEECISDHVEATMNRQPLAPAICAWDGTLTYEELRALSTKLAYKLITLGIKRGSTIPLLFEKSMWMSVSMLAVVKAGGIAVTLDPTVPEDRLGSMTRQVSPKLILTSPENLEIAKRLSDSKTLLVNSSSLAELSSPPTSYGFPPTSSTDTLYIAFTSGSTGQPKGVVVSHRQFVFSIKHQQHDLRITETSRVYDFVSYAWDGTWLNLLHTITAGGCLCVPKESDRRNRLAESIHDFHATYVHLTPTVARLIDPAVVPELKTLVLVGEPLLPSDRTQWTQSEMVLLNAYGPTECTPLSTYEKIGKDSTGTPGIGKGFGANAWVVQTHKSTEQLAPLGAIGELMIEGPTVGQGYLLDAASTAAKFEDNPLWLVNKAHYRGNVRVYKTGDLVRYGSNGNLQFIGRKDTLVKIRGQRVELSDIETHIQMNLPENRQAGLPEDSKVSVVADVLVPAESKTSALVAFVHVQTATKLTEDDIISFICNMSPRLVEKLLKSLPSYMVPKLYIPVSSIATTATGKTDRRALRRVGEALTLQQLSALITRKIEKRAPVSSMQLRLQQLWAGILGIEAGTISIDDSFLQIGGDSVSAMRLTSAARRQGLSLTVSDILSNPRLEDLALATTEASASTLTISPFSLLPSPVDEEQLRGKAADLCKVKPEQIEDVFPCTPLQEGLLALTAKSEGAYTARHVLGLRSSVDAERFSQAWQAVLRATPILRTRIVDLRGTGLVQVVLNTTEQWTGTGEFIDCMREDKSSNMSLGSSLNRYYLTKDSKTRQRFFVWTIHHALYDGWSRGLIIDRLIRAYRGEIQPSPPPFQAFIKHTLGINRSRSEAFWRELFAGMSARPFPELPNAAYQPKASERLSHTISNIKWPKGDITASTMVRAAWSVLVGHYTGANDVLFGTTVIGRQSVPNIEQIAGPTIATIPVRVVLGENKTVDHLLLEVQRQAVKSLEFEQIGLQNLRRLSSDTERACDFQTLLAVHPNSLSDDAKEKKELFEQSLVDLEEAITDDSNSAFNTYALSVVCSLGEDCLTLSISTDPNIMNRVQVRRIQHHFENVLRQLCITTSVTKLAEIKSISPDDLEEIWSWNATVPETAKQCIHELFAEVVQRVHPDTPALCAWDGEFTYKELDYLATRLAHHLVSLGVSRGVIVPLCFEKTVWTPVAQLAVMKAGGAAVVLDSTLPQQRLQSIVTQVEPLVIVCSTSNAKLAKQLTNQNVLVIGETQITQLPRSTARLPVVKPSDLLYVVFTSGSTGVPKGALITHQSFSSSIRHQQHHLAFDSTSRVYDFASYGFDISWANVLQTLTAGACLCIPSEHDRREDIAGSMEKMGVNYAYLTPTVARTIKPSSVPSLRTMNLIGETLSPGDRAQWASEVLLLNTYGPAECTPASTYEQITAASDKEPRIGKGMGANTWVVQANHTDELTPVGVVGELMIEGPIVGSGYLKDDAKTTSAFIQDPLWLISGTPGHPGRRGRLYKTGDLVRYDWDGSLVFVGRKDTQVKIRGQRVDLGDIEHHVLEVLRQITGLQVVADVLKPQESSNPVLVAFISFPGAAELSGIELSTTVQQLTTGLGVILRDALPIYMIPDAYIPVATMPITATGKTNRKELRRVGEAMTLKQIRALNSSSNHRPAPSTGPEKQLQEIWASVLGIAIDSISSVDSFFQVGGDSITAMRLVRTAKEQGLPLTVRDVFSQPKLHELAATVDKKLNITNSSNGASNGQLKSVILTDPHIKVRGVQAKGVHLRPTTEFQAICIDGALQKKKKWWNYCFMDLPPQTKVSKIVDICQVLWDQFDIFRTIFTKSHKQYFQTVVQDQPPNYDIIQEDDDVDVLSRQLCLNDLEVPAALGTFFSKFFIVTTGNGHRRLIIRLSHAQYDGMSLQYVMHSLSAAYNGSQLPKMPQFSEYIDHWLSTAENTSKYWSTLLKDAPHIFNGLTHTSTNQEHDEESKMTSIIRDIEHPKAYRGKTPASTFTAACACAMAKLTGESDVVFGRLVTSRSTLDETLQEVVGPCINFVPVRVKFDDGLSLECAQEIIQDQYVQGMAHQAIGLGDVAVPPKRFGFTVHYQISDDFPVVTLGEHRCQLAYFRAEENLDTGDIEISARPYGKTLRITIGGASHCIKHLNNVMNELCASLQQIK